MTTVALLRVAAATFGLAAVVVACSSSSTGTGSSSSSGGSSGSSGGSCVPSNTDGASSCEGHTEPCPGGQYCSINICNGGCLSTANCPNGQFCDMSAASTDNIINKPVGICRACPASTSSSSGSSGGSCDDVHGAYTLKLDSSSSMGCGMPSGECTVTQSGCKLTLACPGSTGTNSCTIDASDKCSFMTSFTVQGTMINANCGVSFTGSSMLIDCQFTASQGAADCKIDGVKK